MPSKKKKKRKLVGVKSQPKKSSAKQRKRNEKVKINLPFEEALKTAFSPKQHPKSK
jgi:hypothetical protein